MRNRILAMAAAATLALTAAAPAFAADATYATSPKALTCTVTGSATVTFNGTTATYPINYSFSSLKDVSTTVNLTTSFGSANYTISCK